MLWRSWFGGGAVQTTSATTPPSGRPTLLPLVCVRHYQDAVARRAAGDRVYLVREYGNPYDDEAIVVVDTDRATIGLVGRDAPLHGPLLKENAGCSAWIETITRGSSGLLAVTIAVELAGSPIGVRAYRGGRHALGAAPARTHDGVRSARMDRV